MEDNVDRIIFRYDNNTSTKEETNLETILEKIAEYIKVYNFERKDFQITIRPCSQN